MTDSSTALTLRAGPRARAVIENAGGGATLAAEEFFLAGLRNPHTRRAYSRHVIGFLEWCDQRGTALAAVTPGEATAWFETLNSVATQRMALAALRRFFSLLVTRHAVLLNPFDSLQGPRLDRREGKAALITPVQFRQLLGSINLSRPVGHRDRAVIGTLAGTGARVGAISRLRIRDLRDHGDHRALWIREKRGVEREIPVRDDLDRWIHAYLRFVEDGGDGGRSIVSAAGASHPPVRAPADAARHHPGDAQAEAPGRRLALHHLPPLFPGDGRHRPSFARRGHRGRAVSGWPPSLQHHPTL